MKSQVSPKQLARAIQVSESSVKRWCDHGLISTVRTAGGHRRIPMSDVIQFLRSHRYQVLRPEILGLPVTSGQTERVLDRSAGSFRHSLVEGDEQMARGIILDLFMADHDLTVILDDVMPKAMHEVGELWSCGEAQVYQERRACEICMRILHELRQVVRVPDPASGVAIGGTPECDPYHLPNAMADLVIRKSGFDTHDLGVSLPFTTLELAIQNHRPQLFWLSVSHIDDEAVFLRGYENLYANKPPEVSVVAGGQALTEPIRRSMQGASFCENLRQLGAVAASLGRTIHEPIVTRSVSAG